MPLFPTSPAAERLGRADQWFCEQLRQLEASSQDSTQSLHAGELLAAFEAYRQAVLTCLPSTPPWQASSNPTAAELLAEREQSKLYRLGWVRGYQQGQAASQRPAPIDPEVLIQRVRRLVTQMQQRYGSGPITTPLSAPK